MNYSPSPFHIPAAPAPVANTVSAPTSAVIPAKRKRANTAASAPAPAARLHSEYGAHYVASPIPPPDTRLPDAQASANATTTGVGSGSSDDIHCICGFTHDDGLSIACDDCGRWSHMLCFEIRPGHDPDEWRCWECSPRPIDRRRAAKRQEERLAIAAQKPGVPPSYAGSGGTGQTRRRREKEKDKERTGVSVVAPPMSTAALSHSADNAQEDEHVDIEDDWRSAYVPLTEDAVPHTATRAKLRLAAQNWRGVTALVTEEPKRTKVVPLPGARDDVRPPSFTLQTTAPIAGETLIAPFTSTIVPSATYLADPLNAYAHMGMPKPHVHLVPPPLSVALDARMAGNEARFVRSGCRPNAVLRPVLCRRKPKKSRRTVTSSSAEPNGRTGSDSSETDEGAEEGLGDDKGMTTGWRGDGEGDGAGPGVLKFAIFALRDLKACEEVVLSWEWDDGAAVHQLPALIEEGSRAGPSKLTPHHIARLRLQMQSMVHSLRSSFVTCACGGAAHDCALRLMEAVADGEYPLPLSVNGKETEPRHRQRVHKERPRINVDTGSLGQIPVVSDPQRRSPSTTPPPQVQSPLNRHPASLYALQDLVRHSKWRNKERVKLPPDPRANQKMDLGPLVGATRGVRTRVVGGSESGGLRGVELIDGGSWNRHGELEAGELEELERLERLKSDNGDREGLRVPAVHIMRPTPQKNDRKGKGRERLGQDRLSNRSGPVLSGSRSTSPSPLPKTGDVKEERMPPKMRKHWMRRASEKLREAAQVEHTLADGMDIDGYEHERLPSARSSTTSVRTSVSLHPPTQDKHANVNFDSLQMPPPPLPPSIATSHVQSEPPPKSIISPSTATTTTSSSTFSNTPPTVQTTIAATTQQRRSSSVLSLLNEHSVSPLHSSMRLSSLSQSPIQIKFPEELQLPKSVQETLLADPGTVEQLERQSQPQSEPEPESEPPPSPRPESSVPILAPMANADEGNHHQPSSSPSQSQSPQMTVILARFDSDGDASLPVEVAVDASEVSKGSQKPTEDEVMANADDVDMIGLEEPIGQAVASSAGVAVEAGNSLHLTEQPSPELSPVIMDTVIPDASANAMDLDIESTDVPIQVTKSEPEPEPEPEPEVESEIEPENAPKDPIEATISVLVPSSPGPDALVNSQPPASGSPLLHSPSLPTVSLSGPEDKAPGRPLTIILEPLAPHLDADLDVDSLEKKHEILANADVPADSDVNVTVEDRDVHPNSLISRQLSPAVSIVSSTDIRPTPPPSTGADDTSLSSVAADSNSLNAAHNSPTTALAPPEPPKIRRSMADYKQRKRREREEQAARVVASPVTPITPLHSELPMTAVEKDTASMEEAQTVEPEKPVTVNQGGPDEGKVVTEAQKKEEHAPEPLQSSVSSAEPRTPSIEPNLMVESEVRNQTQPLLSPIVQFMAKREISEERIAFSPTPSAHGPDSKASATTEVSHERIDDRDISVQQLPRRRSLEVSRVPPHVFSPPPQAQSVTQGRATTPQPEEDGEITNASSRPSSPSVSRLPFVPIPSGKGLPVSTSVSLASVSKPQPVHVPTRASRPSAPIPPTQPRSLRDVRVHSSSPPRTSRARTPPPPAPSAQPKLPGWAQRERAASGVGLSSGGPSSAGSRPPPPSGPRALRDRDAQVRASPTTQAPGRGHTQPPRGPLADRERSRDRDRERDRDRDRHSPPRGRPPGWARSWGRGRR